MRANPELGIRAAILTVISAGALAGTSSQAIAACVFAPTAGDDAYLCDSGSAPGLNDPGGNNSLTVDGGSITGPVNFGGGADTVIVRSGTTAAIQQGSGIDHYDMSGGTVESLQQGDGYDTFIMTGGTITGAFVDGDFAEQYGGTIGRVDMKLADNFYYLYDGRILGNLVTGFGLDTIEVSGGQIGGNISVSGGDDIVRVSGGTINGEIRMSFGNDTFEWSGGAIFDDILMGADSDIARLTGLDVATLAAAGAIDGGEGASTGAPAASDLLVFDATSAGTGSQYINWETVQLTNGSIFELSDTFALGDATSGGGIFEIDSSSFLQASGAAATIASAGGGTSTVNNAGVIQLSSAGSPNPTDKLTIVGNYHGLNGSLLLDTYLGTDGSASDILEISGGTATGLTGIGVVNAGGPGAGTTGSGILLVNVVNGASTASNAFALDRAVAAGAYEYLLFRGGVNAGEEQNWYLRSQLVQTPVPQAPSAAPPPPAPEAPPVEEGETPQEPTLPPAPVDPAPDPEAENPVDPAPPAPVDPVDPAPPGPIPPDAPPPSIPIAPQPGVLQAVAPTSQATLPDESLLLPGGVIPLYRIEAANYAAIQPAAYLLAIETLSTFHGRRGEQDFLTDETERKRAWFRALGSTGEVGWTGTVAPTFDGSLAGFQVGADLLSYDHGDAGTTQAGLFAGYSHMSGDLRGFALGWADYDTGSMDLGAASIGAYTTHTGIDKWYVDAVLMASLYNGDVTSTRGVGIDIEGYGLLASLEAGYPVALGGGWAIEPQGQIIIQHSDFDDSSDPFAEINFDATTTLTGRLGARLYNRIETDEGFIQPELMANLWQQLGEFTVDLDSDRLTTDGDATYLELGGGFSGKLNDDVSYFANASYSFDIDGAERSVGALKFGLQVKW
ncbi:hypothetical protein VE25_18305 [Devosia geojensis]|uniref:Autotransporter domain-containing protein n=1 Tax=Devosia geojensis TaxID=443610 RepID=A0A0F5FJR4_9HYPH|nr:hypothetical protein VE25_18305 [Devosia geojensis]